jgi:hypothetical protein
MTVVDLSVNRLFAAAPNICAAGFTPAQDKKGRLQESKDSESDSTREGEVLRVDSKARGRSAQHARQPS